MYLYFFMCIYYSSYLMKQPEEKSQLSVRFKFSRPSRSQWTSVRYLGPVMQHMFGNLQLVFAPWKEISDSGPAAGFRQIFMVFV